MKRTAYRYCANEIFREIDEMQCDVTSCSDVEFHEILVGDTISSNDHASGPEDMEGSEDCAIDDDSDASDDSFDSDSTEPTRCLFDESEVEELMFDDENEKCDENSLSFELLQLFLLYSVSRRFVNSLLTILRKYGVDVPGSFYLLKKAFCSKRYSTYLNLPMERGEFRYYGIRRNLDFLIRESHMSRDVFSIQINVDGLPLFKSSRLSVWPILMKLDSTSCSYKLPLPVALYVGSGKPQLDVYVDQLVEELQSLHEHPIELDGRIFSISEVVFIADAPARSFLQEIVGHNGYNGCAYCSVRGEYHNNCVVYPETNSPLRSDLRYRNGDENNQHSTARLSTTPQVKGLFSSFPPEYMHLVLLGVVRRMCKYFFSRSKPRLSCRLNNNQCGIISNKIKELSRFTPNCFSRKLRPLPEFEHWKAVEFRLFLLYLGPIIMKGVLPSNHYKHFLLLHFSIYVFCSDKVHRYFEQAKACLHRFVSQIGDLYGKNAYVYNVHVLSHLHIFVQLYGQLDNFSSFPFENFLGILKKRVKCSSNIAAQITHIFDDLQPMNSDKKSETITTNLPNNCVQLADGSVILIESVHDDTVSGKVLRFQESLYSYPYPSEALSIGYYELSRKRVYSASFARRCFIISLEEDRRFLVIPLAHET